MGVRPRPRCLRRYAGDSYVKDLPLNAAISDALLAYELNGEPLSPEHGYPLRLVMPGYYGTNSVKWIYRLELARARAQGLFTTKFYNDPVSPSDQRSASASRPVWQTAPELVIVSPEPKKQLSGAVVEIWGWAWAHRGVRQVEVSVDGGRTWRLAELGEATERSWQKFRLQWRLENQGPAVLMSRAVDRAGEMQPRDGARNAIHAVAVEVIATG